MLVKDLMSRRLVTVRPFDSVQHAAHLMARYNISGLFVLKEGKLTGVITMKDIFKKILVFGKDMKKEKVKDYMSFPVACVQPLTTVEEAAKLMSKKKVKRLAVTDNEQGLLGIVTLMDIVSNVPQLINVMIETWVKPSWR